MKATKLWAALAVALVLGVCFLGADAEDVMDATVLVESASNQGPASPPHPPVFLSTVEKDQARSMAHMHAMLRHKARSTPTAKLCNGEPCENVAKQVGARKWDTTGLFKSDHGVATHPAAVVPAAATSSSAHSTKQAQADPANPLPTEPEIDDTKWVEVKDTPTSRGNPDPVARAKEALEEATTFHAGIDEQTGSPTGRMLHMDQHGVAQMEKVKLLRAHMSKAADLEAAYNAPTIVDRDGRPFAAIVPATTMLDDSDKPKPSETDQVPGAAVRWVPLAIMNRITNLAHRGMPENKRPFAHSNDLDFTNFAYDPYVHILKEYKDGADFNLDNALNHPEKLLNTIDLKSNVKRAPLGSSPDGELQHVSAARRLDDGYWRPFIGDLLPKSDASASPMTGQGKVVTGDEDWQALGLTERPLVDGKPQDANLPMPSGAKGGASAGGSETASSASASGLDFASGSASASSSDSSASASAGEMRFREVMTTAAQVKSTPHDKMLAHKLAEAAKRLTEETDANVQDALKGLQAMESKRAALEAEMANTRNRLNELGHRELLQRDIKKEDESEVLSHFEETQRRLKHDYGMELNDQEPPRFREALPHTSARGHAMHRVAAHAAATDKRLSHKDILKRLRAIHSHIKTGY